jgi:hypothetical protein
MRDMLKRACAARHKETDHNNLVLLKAKGFINSNRANISLVSAESLESCATNAEIKRVLGDIKGDKGPTHLWQVPALRANAPANRPSTPAKRAPKNGCMPGPSGTAAKSQRTHAEAFGGLWMHHSLILS